MLARSHRHHLARSWSATLLAALLVMTVLVLTGTGVGAQTRDVEVTPGQPLDGQLRALPAVSLDEDVLADGRWPVALVNGGSERVSLLLDVQGVRAGNPGVEADGTAVPWATIPRDRVELDPGERADLTIALDPVATNLPALVALTATTVGDDTRSVTAVRLVAAEPLDPTFEVVQADGAIVLRTLDVPAIVDMRLRASARLGPDRTRDVGPLVLVPGTDRRVPFTAPESALGGSTEVAIAIDGRDPEVVTYRVPADLARLTVYGVAALLLALAATLAVRRARR